MFDFLSIKKTLADVGKQVSDLRSQIETLQRQREDIVSAPATRADVKEMVAQWVERKSTEYMRRLEFNLQEFVTHPKNLKCEKTVGHRMTLFGTTRQLGALTMFPGPELEDMAICCLFGPALITSLNTIIDAMENWPAGGIPMRERGKKIKDIDAQIDKLMSQESALVSAAQEAGVQIG